MPPAFASPRVDAARRLIDLVLRPEVDTSRLDATVDRAASALGAASSQLSLLGECQVAGSVGGASDQARGTATAYEDTICAWTLRSDTPVSIADARRDARVSTIPSVQDGSIVAYLGAPIRTEQGIVAVLCVFDPEPREWTDDDLRTLTELADDVSSELHRLSATSGAA